MFSVVDDEVEQYQYGDRVEIINGPLRLVRGSFVRYFPDMGYLVIALDKLVNGKDKVIMHPGDVKRL